MIENIKYEDMLSYSKELKASADVISSLIQNKELPELENFVNDVVSYSKYLESTVNLYIKADDALDYLSKMNKTSN